MVSCKICRKIRCVVTLIEKTRYFTIDYDGIAKAARLFRKRRTARLPEVVNLYYDQWVDQTARVRTEVETRRP